MSAEWDRMPSALELLIAIKATELDALASQLKRSNESVQTLANTQPGTWARQLAELAVLCDYADSLPAEFAGFVAQQVRRVHTPITRD